MDPLTLMLITTAVGGGLGLMGAEEKRKAAERQRPVEAAKAKWYGWTHDTPQTFQDPNYLAELIQGGLGGFAGGANIATALGSAGMMGNTPSSSSGASGVTPITAKEMSLPANSLLGTPAMGGTPDLTGGTGYLSTNRLPVPGPSGGFSTQVGRDPSVFFGSGAESLEIPKGPLSNIVESTKIPQTSSPILPTSLPKKKPTGKKTGKKVSMWQELLKPYGSDYYEGV